MPGAQRKGPVRWFSPGVLWTSGKEAATATEFARFADQRQQQAAAPAQIYDLSEAGEGGFAFDYVADTGDGYDATYAVACSINGGGHGFSDLADRANLLVLGGDEVYPVASTANYLSRLALPYRDLVTERPGGLRGTQGFVVALPGNHDWYDGLVSFQRNFCESRLRYLDAGLPVPEGLVRPEPDRGDEYLDRRTFQSRSYFAVKLPHGWWLWGLDSQLDAHVDAEQLEYFLQARQLVEEHERVILCTARPSWVDPPQLDRGDFKTNRETLVWFVNRMFGSHEQRSDTLDSHTAEREGTRPSGFERSGMSQVPLLITGDKHHYVRYRLDATDVASQATNVPRHLVTCGGGGAYLSSTHHSGDSLSLPWSFESRPQSSYSFRSAYPDRTTSKRLGRSFLRIGYKNGVAFPTLLAAVDLTLFLVFRAAWSSGGGVTPKVLAVVCFAVVCGLLGAFSGLFRPGHRPALLGFGLGAVHAGLHAALAVAAVLITEAAGSGVWVAVLGALVAVLAPVVFAVFLRLCDSNLLAWHENEFFSGMGFETYKSFLRINVLPVEGSQTGILKVTAYGIERPPGNRRRRGEAIKPTVTVVDEFTVAAQGSTEK
jgi:hypothetical protein